jgi:hypothetical protein
MSRRAFSDTAFLFALADSADRWHSDCEEDGGGFIVIPLMGTKLPERLASFRKGGVVL